MDKRIDELEVVSDMDRESFMVHLAPGWCLNDQGCHTFGEDDKAAVRATMKHVKPCKCSECA